MPALAWLMALHPGKSLHVLDKSGDSPGRAHGENALSVRFRPAIRFRLDHISVSPPSPDPTPNRPPPRAATREAATIVVFSRPPASEALSGGLFKDRRLRLCRDRLGMVRGGW